VPMPSRHPDWQRVYVPHSATELPWFYPSLDPDLKVELELRKIDQGRFLDVGTGIGSQANALHHLGLDVIGIDIATSAIDIARQFYPNVSFVVDDIRNSGLKESFDYAFDRGCFHVLEPEEYEGYLASLRRLIKGNGLLFLKCFSHEEGDSDVGPLRFSPTELATIFKCDFRLDSVRRTSYQGPRPHQPSALFATFKKPY